MGTVDPGPIRLVLASEAREFRGILRNCGPVKPIGGVGRFCVAASWQGVPWIFAADGPGPRIVDRLLRVLEKNANDTGIDVVISTGYCGALDPQLRLGDVVEATRVFDVATGRNFPVRPAAVTGGHLQTKYHGSVVSQDRVATTAVEKAELRRTTGAVAVEMEAGAVASWAASRGLPFYCIRAVSDTAAESMPLDMNAMRDEEGRFDLRKIASRALRSPFRVAPALVRFERGCRIAERNLGEFFANCRFE